MFLSKCEDLELYDSVVGKIVSTFLNENDVHTIPTGRYELPEGCFVNVDEYETGVNTRYEAHQEYVDVHVMVDGEEYIWCAKIYQGTEVIPYDAEKDVAFYTCVETACRKVHMTNQSALVLMPRDIHAPANLDRKRHNRKIIFKIPVHIVQNQLFHR